MKTQIKSFSCHQFGEVRTVTSTNNEPLFCLPDVCRVLGLTASKISQRLEGDVLFKYPIVDTLGRTQHANFVNEDGLYDVILGSRKPEARAFRKWITSDILPSIRKHGGYLTQEKVEEALLNPDTLIRLATSLKEEQTKRLKVEAVVKSQAPQVLFAKAVEASNKSVLIGEMAKIITQNGIPIGQNKLFTWMRNNGYLCSRGSFYNLPTQRSMEMELFEIKKTTITKPNGTTLVTTTPKVTGKGQIYFINKFLS